MVAVIARDAAHARCPHQALDPPLLPGLAPCHHLSSLADWFPRALTSVWLRCVGSERLPRLRQGRGRCSHHLPPLLAHLPPHRTLSRPPARPLVSFSLLVWAAATKLAVVWITGVRQSEGREKNRSGLSREGCCPRWHSPLLLLHDASPPHRPAFAGCALWIVCAVFSLPAARPFSFSLFVAAAWSSD